MPSLFEILRSLVAKPDCLIFDVGANFGQSTELYRLLFEGCTVHAFEPQQDNFDEMTRRVGGLDRVILNHVALGDRVGTATLYRSTHCESSSLLPLNPDSWWRRALDIHPGGTEAIAIDTIDHYCAERQIDTIDFLKLDVQGFEPECLIGASRMLEAGRIGVIQAELANHPLYARATRFSDIEGPLISKGYRLYTICNVSVGDVNGELLSLEMIFVRA